MTRILRAVLFIAASVPALAAAQQPAQRQLEMTEVSVGQSGRAPRTYPSLLPLLRLDRIYVRGFSVAGSRVHGGKPWSMLSDHLAVSAELERS